MVEQFLFYFCDLKKIKHYCIYGCDVLVKQFLVQAYFFTYIPCALQTSSNCLITEEFEQHVLIEEIQYLEPESDTY